MTKVSVTEFGNVPKLAKTAIDCPPIPAGESLNLDAVTKQIAASQAAHWQWFLLGQSGIDRKGCARSKNRAGAFLSQ